MAATHAQIARNLLAGTDPAVFARAAQPVILHQDYTQLELMFPGMRFSSRPIGVDLVELVGTCDDGSSILWRLGG